MCGIAGELRLDGRPARATVVEAMADSLVHRGPDSGGCWHDGSVALGHRRLSIIDLDGSAQPMISTDGRWALVFNGEIFNYRELRQQLRGYPFCTGGDTETILAGIVKHGVGFVDRLVGQFAIAVYDRRSRIMHLVRDRLGILPLYYYLDSHQLIFGSEIKAILSGLDSRPGVDLSSLDDYLWGRSVPSPHTLFDGIYKVQPGHRIEVAVGRELSDHCYWQPPAPTSVGWSAGAAVEAVDAAVGDAVRSALVADVPVGAYLSGGVDSSLIVAKAARFHPGRLKTFAASFGDPRYDELDYARQVSEHVGTDHHEVRVDAADFEELWPTLTWHRDAPMSEPADFAVFRLAQAARAEVKVVLSGEGGDELFGGYPKYRVARAMATASIVPGGVRRAIGGRLDQHLPERLARLRIALRVWSTPGRDEQYRAWFAPFSVAERMDLLGQVAARDTTQKSHTRDPIRAMLLSDLHVWLPDNLLERGDRMSMATSLELRPPLLDHRLTELAFRLPSSVKVRSGQTKWVLKEVARRYLPAQIVDRRKIGFRVPLDAWFRTSLRDTMFDRLSGPGSFVGEVFDRSAVRRLLERHDSGAFNEEIRIWTLMSLQVWHETFFSASRPSATTSTRRES
ncbi:asparagine synthase (glutamine-hydrolyzing) [Microlunatus soli]|uniref:asparagine synthase (glutamine-hydrolyzing) n=1 Tax=Microlunatus soli TaxID=630515 RepID=A0A1H1SP03_9ACTN|nr:asparagine synthase (glutamine-hydrolyzing) [Microlunatus soli]SDS49720.1 asparagine synthase (glutamine-hydrolysing) [Microlunatus soli]